MTGLLAAATAFFVLHLVPSTPLRRSLVASWGEGPYMGAFAILSLATIWWLVSQFIAAPFGTKLWSVPDWWLWLKAALILFAFILAVCGFLTPNPSTPAGTKALSNPKAAEGIFAVTRHPVMWGIAIWAMAHMISQATVRGFLFFGTFAATALIGCWLQQQRKRKTLPNWSAFEGKTSYFPFAAILEGRAKLSLGAIGWWRIAIAVVLWALIIHFHYAAFGVRPLPTPA
ncbi:MAG: NnrU family protein [Rhodomicrobium sp.]